MERDLKREALGQETATSVKNPNAKTNMIAHPLVMHLQQQRELGLLAKSEDTEHYEEDLGDDEEEEETVKKSSTPIVSTFTPVSLKQSVAPLTIQPIPMAPMMQPNNMFSLPIVKLDTVATINNSINSMNNHSNNNNNNQRRLSVSFEDLIRADAVSSPLSATNKIAFDGFLRTPIMEAPPMDATPDLSHMLKHGNLGSFDSLVMGSIMPSPMTNSPTDHLFKEATESALAPMDSESIDTVESIFGPSSTAMNSMATPPAVNTSEILQHDPFFAAESFSSPKGSRRRSVAAAKRHSCSTVDAAGGAGSLGLSPQDIAQWKRKLSAPELSPAASGSGSLFQLNNLPTQSFNAPVNSPNRVNGKTIITTFKDGKPEKAYPCLFDGCGKLFKRYEHMRRHMRSHTGEK